MRRLRAISPVIAAVVIVFVLGIVGGAVAAGTITGASIKDNSVTTKDIKNGTLKANDLAGATKKALKGNQGPAGAPGAQGAQGAPGAQGPPGPGAGKAVVTGNAATAALDGWAVWVDNRGNPNPVTYAIEVYCASGAAWVSDPPFTVPANGENGGSLSCDPGDHMIGGGYYNTVDPGAPGRARPRAMHKLSQADRHRFGVN